MRRRLAIPLSLAALLTGGLFLALVFMGPDGPDHPGLGPTSVVTSGDGDSTAGPVVSEGPAVLDGAASLLVDAPLTATVEVGEGLGSIRGVAYSPWGGTESGAEITLHRVSLPAEVEEAGGLSLWRLRREGRVSAVEIELRHCLAPAARAESDEAGEFSFRGVGVGTFVVSGLSPGRLRTPTSVVHVSDSSVVEVPLRLQEAAELRVQITDPEGQAVAGARVGLRGNPGRPGEDETAAFVPLEKLFLCLLNPIERQGTSDAEGAILFAILPPLEYQVTISAPPYARAERIVAIPGPTLDVVLEEGATLEGWVESEDDGEPVAGAWVNLRPEGGQIRFGFLKAPERWTTETRADGSFRFEGVNPGTYEIRAGGPGFQTESLLGQRVENGEEAQVVLPLERGFEIRGVVKGPAAGGGDVPLAGVEVRVAPKRNGRGPTLESVTVGDGLFVFDTLTDTSYRIEIRHADWASQSFEVTPDPEVLEVTLERGLDLTGQFVDSDGEPVAGARAWIWRRGERARRATSDLEGHFRFGGLAEAEYRLSVRAEGFSERRETVDPTARDLGRLRLVLERAAFIDGFVVGPDGLPLAGARVRAHAHRIGNERPRASSAYCRSDGSFVLALSAHNWTWNLTADSPGLLASQLRDLRVKEGLDGVELILDWGGVLKGTIASVRGPVPGAIVTVRTDGGKRGRTVGQVATRADGAFRLGGLSEGRYRVAVRAPGFARFSEGNIDVGSNQIIPLDMFLELERLISGFVVDPDGVALYGARVRVSGASGSRVAETAADGAFEVGELDGQPMLVRVNLADHVGWSRKGVYPANSPLEVVLKPTFSLTGLVLHSRYGEPIAAANVALDRYQPPGGKRRPWKSRHKGRTDDDGVFEIRGVREGVWAVAVSAGGYLSRRVEPVRVPPPTREPELDIGLDPGGEIRGEVVNHSARAVSRARVNAYLIPAATGKKRRSPRRVASTRTDADGAYLFRGLREGTYQLRIYHFEYLSDRLDDLEVEVGRPGPVHRTTLERAARVEGEVLSRGGRRVSKGEVHLDGGQPRVRRRVNLRKDGTFRVGSLPGGAYRISFRRSSKAPEDGVQDLRLSKNERREVRLYLENR